MKNFLLVALGGGLGASARYFLSTIITVSFTGHKFPFGTFIVNSLGCLIAGIVVGFAERGSVLGPESRLLIVTGILGGFTTFSAFGIETTSLIKQRELLLAALYIALTTLVSLTLLWTTYRLVAGRTN